MKLATKVLESFKRLSKINEDQSFRVVDSLLKKTGWVDSDKKFPSVTPGNPSTYNEPGEGSVGDHPVIIMKNGNAMLQKHCSLYTNTKFPNFIISLWHARNSKVAASIVDISTGRKTEIYQLNLTLKILNNPSDVDFKFTPVLRSLKDFKSNLPPKSSFH